MYVVSLVSYIAAVVVDRVVLFCQKAPAQILRSQNLHKSILELTFDMCRPRFEARVLI